MRALRVGSMLFGLLTSVSLLFCGALIAGLVPQAPELIWLAMLCFWMAMWGSR